MLRLNAWLSDCRVNSVYPANTNDPAQPDRRSTVGGCPRGVGLGSRRRSWGNDSQGVFAGGIFAQSLLWFAVVFAVLVPTWAEASVVYNSANDSFYMVVRKSINWSDARAESQSLQHEGRVGHLATVTSAAENLFLTNTFDNSLIHYTWLGGYQPPGSIESAGGWSWVTGEAFSFSNWFRGSEPNGGDFENELVFDHLFTTSGKTWNDLRGEWMTAGYIVEFSGLSDLGQLPKESGGGGGGGGGDPPNPNPVPEPQVATLAVVAVSLLWLMRLRQRTPGKLCSAES